MSRPPHLLVIRRRYLGDIVLLGSVFRNLRLHWPQAKIAALVEAPYADVLTLNPDVDEVFHFPQSVRDWPRLVWRLRGARFTHVFDFDNRDKTAFLTRATGAPHRLTLRHAEPVHFPRFYTFQEFVAEEFLDNRHITDLYLRLLERSGFPTGCRTCRLTSRAADLASIRALPEIAGLPADRPHLLVHPGSRSLCRLWPEQNFAAVCDQLQRAGLAHVAIVGGPPDQPIMENIRRHMQTAVAMIPHRLTIPQLAALFASFDLLLCHDSGPMHLATAVGTRVVALYGSQEISHWRPLGEGHVTLQPPLPCVSCVAPGVCIPQDSYHNYCVRNITPDRVYAAVAGALTRQGPLLPVPGQNV